MAIVQNAAPELAIPFVLVDATPSDVTGMKDHAVGTAYLDVTSGTKKIWVKSAASTYVGVTVA